MPPSRVPRTAFSLVHDRGGDDVHAKLLVVDHDRAFVGSEDFSWNSLSRNREAGLVVARGEADVERIERTFASDWGAAPVFALATSESDPSR